MKMLGVLFIERLKRKDGEDDLPFHGSGWSP